ncbi:ABC transporter ATP-binding protein [Nonomuraea zeae]|uniref:ABC transporter ATP-binding protein n=1 Tax=Nonomuraea zeae TaxID=1642303 RepID=A0A5S4GXJ5_9ACTN|nr:ABC transporter ATP-binding protein [Nonomuraea zeae]TMR37184.1 ABC transporter ATP-binding protein [Nonomuraea zeae]
MSDPVSGTAGEQVTHRHGDRLLASLARRAWRPLAVVAAGTAAGSAATLAMPALLAAAVDGVLSGQDVLPAAALLALVLAVLTLADLARAIAGAASNASGTAALRLRFTDHLLRLGAGEARRFPAGELANRLVSNTATAGHVPLTLLDTVAALVTAVGGITALFLIDWRTGVAFVAGVPVALAVILFFVTRMSGLYDRYQEAQGRLAARLTDTLAGIRTVRASGTAGREIDRVLAPLPALSEAGHALWRTQARGVWRIGLVLPLIEVAVLAVAGLGVVDGRLAPGQLLAVAAYAALGLSFIEQVDTAMSVAQARSAARRLCQVLALPAQVPGTRPAPDGPGALSFRGVTVTRDGARLLDDLDLDIPAGLLTAVVGPSGAGKTTLAMVAGRLLDPDRGQVSLDGRALAEIASLTDVVAYAFERPALLGGDLAAAIAYGRPGTGRAAVREAAAAARVDDVIRRLPKGYDTPADGVPLSGGELQRLGLARALVRHARVTVLDDATSSLDTATEAQVTRALVDGMRGRTRLVIAHRVTTAARADLVVWLENGRVRARGTHQELWTDPAYRALFATLPTVGEEEPCPVLL